MEEQSIRSRVVEALIEATASDPFRDRESIIEEVAGVLGIGVDEVHSRLPAPGTVSWVRDTAPTRIAQGGGFALDDVVGVVALDDIEAELESDDAARRRSAVDRLMIAATPSAEASALVLRALGDPEPQVRLAALPGSWRLASKEVAARCRELAVDDPDDEVRIAAITRLGLNGDRDPETVKALVSMVDADLPVDVRAAALTGLGRCGLGYARVPSVVRARLSWATEREVRSAAMRTSCLLTTTEEADDFIAHVVPVLSRHPDLALDHQAELLSLADRVPAIVRALEERATHNDRHGRRACAYLLGAVITHTAPARAHLLARLAEDIDDDVRAAAEGAARSALERMTEAERSSNRDLVMVLAEAAGD